jgi:DNA mismatch repair protein MutS2
MTTNQKTLADLEWHRIQEALAKRCSTPLGEEAALALFPELTRGQITQELAATQELQKLHTIGEPPPFGAMIDLRQKLSHAEKGGVLEGADLVMIADHMNGAHNLRRHLLSRAEKAPVASDLAMAMPDLSSFAVSVSRCFDEAGKLKDSASSELGHLRQTANRLSEQLKKTISRLLTDSKVALYLQDNYYTVRDDRYVLPVKAENRPEIKGIVHGTSGSGATLYIETEEVVDLGNRYKIALAAVEREELRILAELTSQVVQRAPQIRDSVKVIAHLDLINSKAKLALDLELTAPDIQPDGGDLALKGARHPHLLLQGVAVIANQIELTQGARVLIISGPNTGGKTVSLKTAGLCAIFLRAGIPIPADAGSKLPLYREVFSDIGDEQSIERSLSTFSGRMLNTLHILKEASPHDLILLDEIAAGTEPAQGAAIACAVLDSLAKSRAHVLTSTHYELPKTLALQNPIYKNASVGFDTEKLAPTYKLHLGIPGRSSAFEIAQRLGAPRWFTESAKRFLSEGGRAFEDVLLALDRERHLLEEERRRLTIAADRAEADARRAQTQYETLKAKEKAMVGGQHQGLVKALAEARAAVENIDRKLRERVENHPKDRQSQEAMVRQMRQSIESATDIEKKTSQKLEDERRREREKRAAKPAELTPGQSVYIASFDARGTVDEAPDEKGRVKVRIGTLKTTVSVEELSITSAPKEKKEEAKEYVSSLHKAPAPYSLENLPPMTNEVTLDLRGMRVDEALQEADQFLDLMLQQDKSVCFFIHGHGTGAVKQAIRDFLRSSSLIANIRPGDQKFGGDGITVAQIA